MDRFLVRKRPADAGGLKQISILFGSSKWKQFRIDMELYGFLCICICICVYVYDMYLCIYMYMLDMHVYIYIFIYRQIIYVYIYMRISHTHTSRICVTSISPRISGT